MEILEAMIGNENTEEEIEQWTENHRAIVVIYDVRIEEIKNIIFTLKIERKADNTKQEERRIQRGLEEERRILEMQMEMKKKEEKKKEYSLLNDCKFSKAKLRKLVITKFDGTHFDWFRFWNQFKSQIDKCNLPQVLKFFDLKELVIPKVRLLIDGLHFTSEVANARVQNIMSLPQINNANPGKIHDFSEKVLCSVQALDTMGRIKKLNGYVRVTQVKLQGIREDLVRNDDN